MQSRCMTFFLCFVYAFFLASVAVALAEEATPELELEKENVVYRVQATPQGPEYAFIRKGDVVYLVQEGKEIKLAETYSSPRGPACPYLYLDDADFDGVADIFLRQDGGSIGDNYLIFDKEGKEITGRLFGAMGSEFSLVFPSVDKDKKMLSTTELDQMRPYVTLYSFRDGQYQYAGSEGYVTTDSMRLHYTTMTNGTVSTHTNIQGEDENGELTSAIEVYTTLSVPLLRKPSLEAAVQYQIPKGTTGKIIDVQWADKDLWIQISVKNGKHTGWLLEGDGMVIRAIPQ